VPTAVVCAAFDGATDDAVYAARDVVRAAGVHLPDRPPHRPHLSLAAATVRKDELAQVVDVARAVAAAHRPVELALDEVGRFGRSGVVWLGPATRIPALDALQAGAHAALQTQGWEPAFGVHSDPDQWVPHCTLATRLDKPLLRQVQQTLSATYRPIAARVDALAVILVGGRGDIAHLPLAGLGC